MENKEDKHYHFFESKLGPIVLRNMLGPSFDSTILTYFLPFCLLQNMLKPQFKNALSKINMYF